MCPENDVARFAQALLRSNAHAESRGRAPPEDDRRNCASMLRSPIASR
jgi:hypothetical protein